MENTIVVPEITGFPGETEDRYPEPKEDSFENPEMEDSVPPFPEEDDKWEYGNGNRRKEEETEEEDYIPPFNGKMSVEELAELFLKGVGSRGEPVEMVIDGTTVHVEADNDHSQNNTEEKEEGTGTDDGQQVPPEENEHVTMSIYNNALEKELEDIWIYLNGKQVDIEEFCRFIDAHKAEFIAACNREFPNLEKSAHTGKSGRNDTERKSAPERTKRAIKTDSVPGRSSERKSLPENGDLDAQMRKVSRKAARDEMRYAQDQLFDSGKKVNAPFYLYGKDGNIGDVVELYKYTGKDGEEKTGMKVNGCYAREKEVTELLMKYPNQMRKQADAYLAVQNKQSTKTKNIPQEPVDRE